MSEKDVMYQVIRNNKVVAVVDKPYTTVEHVEDARYILYAQPIRQETFLRPRQQCKYLKAC